MIVLSHDDVRQALDMPGCIEAMAGALSSMARGEVDNPLRFITRAPDGKSFMGMMPAQRLGDDPLYSLKSIVVVPANPARGLDAHQGTVTLFDGETGQVRAVIDASAVTEIRTAAVSAVATRLLARDDAKTLAVLGAGVQGRAHVEALRHVRDFDRVLIVSRTRAHADELAAQTGAEALDSAEDAVRAADVVVTATNSRDPVLQRDWLKPGAHVNAVGSSMRTARELDSATVADGSLFVDRRESTVNEAGDYLIPLEEGAISGPDHIKAELGELLTGSHPGRTSPDELTVFKSLGIAVEDLAAAEYAIRRARELGIGSEVDF